MSSSTALKSLIALAVAVTVGSALLAAAADSKPLDVTYYYLPG